MFIPNSPQLPGPGFGSWANAINGKNVVKIIILIRQLIEENFKN